MKFVANIADSRGVLALNFLHALGFEVRYVKNAELALEDEIAVFTPAQIRYVSKNGRFCQEVLRGGHFLVVGIAMKHVPTWAQNAGNTIAIKRVLSRKKNPNSSLLVALRGVAIQFQEGRLKL